MRFLNFTEGLILSICFHLAFVGIILIYNMKFPIPQPQNTVAIEYLQAPPSLAELEAKIKTRPRTENIKNQVVAQNEKSKNQEKPDDTRFLSAQNQKVEKQTVAKDKGEFKNAAKPALKKALKMAQQSPSKNKTDEKTKPSLLNLNPTFDPLAIKERQQKSESKTTAGDDHESVEGGDVSQTDDYIKNIDQGSQTMLNAREFKYYTYYSRIRRQLSQHWEPKVREKLVRLFRQGRTIASDRDHTTKLLIILSESGKLVNVQILGESGVHDLDDAAMDAFRSAAPFPNPPKGIIEADKTVKIRWDFVLES